MGIIKIRKDDNLASHHQLIKEELFRSEMLPRGAALGREPDSKSWRFGLVVISLSVLIGLLYWFAVGKVPDAPLPYVLFDLKAIDELGHPVAGAEVKVQGKISGITDSFGEWRRFMRSELGSRVQVEVEKQYEKRKIAVSRELQIPAEAPETGEVELTQTLQMSELAAVSSRVEPKRTERQGRGENQDIVNASAQAKSESSEQHQVSNPYDSLWFTLDDGGKSNQQGALDRQAQAFLRSQIMPALHSRAEVLGLTMDNQAPWQIHLRHINGSANDESKGIILVTANIPGSDGKIEFLKNYQADPLVTARSILWGLKMHVARAYKVNFRNGAWLVENSAGAGSLWELSQGMVLMGPKGKAFAVGETEPGQNGRQLRLNVSESHPCEKNGVKKLSCELYSSHLGVLPPSPEWQRLKLHLYGIVDGMNIYVSGYRAIHEGGKVWSYWGLPGNLANLTVLEQDRVVFRRKLGISSSQVPIITIPGSRMSLR